VHRLRFTACCCSGLLLVRCIALLLSARNVVTATELVHIYTRITALHNTQQLDAAAGAEFTTSLQDTSSSSTSSSNAVVTGEGTPLNALRQRLGVSREGARTAYISAFTDHLAPRWRAIAEAAQSISSSSSSTSSGIASVAAASTVAAAAGAAVDSAATVADSEVDDVMQSVLDVLELCEQSGVVSCTHYSTRMRSVTSA
jgi:hypothetical protein